MISFLFAIFYTEDLGEDLKEVIEAVRNKIKSGIKDNGFPHDYIFSGKNAINALCSN